MPKVVYKKPDAFVGAAQAATGYLEGRVAGEQQTYERGQAAAAAAEDTRRFEATTANAIQDRKQAFGEEVRQFDANDKFKRDNLDFLAREGLAERDLKQTLQTEDLGAQKERLGMQLTQSEKENARDNSTRRYGITKQAQADQSRLALQRAELQGSQQKLDFAQQMIGKYGDPKIKPYTPQIRDQIRQEARDQFLGPGTTTGQQDVIQATPEQIAQIDRMADSVVDGYNSLRTQVTGDHIALADQMGAVEAKYKNGAVSEKAGGFRLDQIYDPNESAVDPLSGQRLLSDEFYQQVTTPQAEVMYGIETYIDQTATGSASLPKADAYSVNDQAERHIKDLLGSPEFQNMHPATVKTLTEYYTDRLMTSMYNARNPPVPAGPPEPSESGSR